jgi:hypothetical protein
MDVDSLTDDEKKLSGKPQFGLPGRAGDPLHSLCHHFKDRYCIAQDFKNVESIPIAQFGTVWYNMVPGTVRHCTGWYGTAWYDTVRHVTVWLNTVRLGTLPVLYGELDPNSAK